MQEKRLKKLAQRMESLAEKDERLVQRALNIEQQRCQAAQELHLLCASFVAEMNNRLDKTKIELAPPEFPPNFFHLSGLNLFQLNIRGRIVQFEFKPTEELVSTENFRVPYTLEGTIRCFNQELLDRSAIVEHQLFYCVAKRSAWRYFDTRTYRTGVCDANYLLSLLEALV